MARDCSRAGDRHHTKRALKQRPSNPCPNPVSPWEARLSASHPNALFLTGTLDLPWLRALRHEAASSQVMDGAEPEWWRRQCNARSEAETRRSGLDSLAGRQRARPPTHDTYSSSSLDLTECGGKRRVSNHCRDDRELGAGAAPRRASFCASTRGAFHRASSSVGSSWGRETLHLGLPFRPSWGSARRPTLRRLGGERTSALLVRRSDPARLLRLKRRGS